MKKFSKFLLAFSLFLLLPGLTLAGCKEEGPRYYTVTYCAENGEALQYVRVLEGERAEYTLENPTKDENEGYVYSFSTWVNKNGKVVNLASVKSDLKVYPKFNAQAKEYTIEIPENVIVVASGGNILADGDTVLYGDKVIISCNVPEGRALQHLRANATQLKNGDTYTITGDTIISYTTRDAAASARYGTYIYMYKVDRNALVSNLPNEDLVTFINFTEQHFTLGTNISQLSGEDEYVLFEDLDYVATGSVVTAESGEKTFRATLETDGLMSVQIQDEIAYFVLLDEFDDSPLNAKTFMTTDQRLKLAFNTTEKTIVYDTYETVTEDRDNDGIDEEYDEPVHLNLTYKVYGGLLLGVSGNEVVLVGQVSYFETVTQHGTVEVLALRMGENEVLMYTQDGLNVIGA